MSCLPGTSWRVGHCNLRASPPKKKGSSGCGSQSAGAYRPVGAFAATMAVHRPPGSSPSEACPAPAAAVDRGCRLAITTSAGSRALPAARPDICAAINITTSARSGVRHAVQCAHRVQLDTRRADNERAKPTTAVLLREVNRRCCTATPVQTCRHSSASPPLEAVQAPASQPLPRARAYSASGASRRTRRGPPHPPSAGNAPAG